MTEVLASKQHCNAGAAATAHASAGYATLNGGKELEAGLMISEEAKEMGAITNPYAEFTRNRNSGAAQMNTTLVNVAATTAGEAAVATAMVSQSREGDDGALERWSSSSSGVPINYNYNPHIIEADEEEHQQQQVSLVEVVVEALRRSGLTCHSDHRLLVDVDIGWPTNVRHVAHVTFDPFHGFLGLPPELQREVPRRVPSASVSVFGVSAESMQCSYDGNGNSVPTILLLLQERLYDQGGLKAEGIFRINAENSQEQHVREQINSGIVPYDIDVHCLAGLIKAWFRELPKGVLDRLSPEQVMQCETEEQAVAMVKTLPPMERALLDWGVNLMADVVQHEHLNKMNAHNIAMVFAPNMTQMSDPLTALMHAVQVMNLLKTLILRTLRERAEASLDPTPASSRNTDPPPGGGHGEDRDEESSSYVVDAGAREGAMAMAPPLDLQQHVEERGEEEESDKNAAIAAALFRRSLSDRASSLSRSRQLVVDIAAAAATVCSEEGISTDMDSCQDRSEPFSRSSTDEDPESNSLIMSPDLTLEAGKETSTRCVHVDEEEGHGVRGGSAATPRCRWRKSELLSEILMRTKMGHGLQRREPWATTAPQCVLRFKGKREEEEDHVSVR